MQQKALRKIEELLQRVLTLQHDAIALHDAFVKTREWCSELSSQTCQELREVVFHSLTVTDCMVADIREAKENSKTIKLGVQDEEQRSG